MKILLAQNSLYYPSHGGGDKSNRLLMEALAGRGHDCSVVARLGTFGSEEHARFLRELETRNVRVLSAGAGVVVFKHEGVDVHVVTGNLNLRSYFAEQAAAFSPDAIVASTDDPAQLLLEAALRSGGARVVYLVRATLALPFGPDCAFPSAPKTEMLRKVDGVAGVSRYVAEYVRKWGGIGAVHVPISLLDPGPYPPAGRFDNPFVTLVNPCAVKGIAVFLALAEKMPAVEFAAVPTWGTTLVDRAALGALPNVRILDPVDDIGRIMEPTRVLLVPSLWAEARSRIVVEAMLRGIPVIASNVGGIPEAKMGVPYLLPVRPIEKYRPRVDERMVPVAEVPPQDAGPWHEALGRLTTDREHWEQISRASRQAALAYAGNLSVAPFERYLEEVVHSSRGASIVTGPETPGPAPSALDQLSPEKRSLLTLRLRRKSVTPDDAGNPWFPTAALQPDAALRLFCFPYAGGGVAAFRGWAEAFPREVAVCPARLPGRESRLPEPPIRRMGPLVDAIGEAILPLLEHPFAFFGHSMGAGIAFELSRLLRRHGGPQPFCLLVAGARAPQYRLGHVPPADPSEEQFLADIRRLEGVPAKVLEHEELMKVILPALRADTELYRNYVYSAEPPLSIPIRAYGGEEDPNVGREHLEAWAAQTATGFKLRMFPGGHFFIHSRWAQFLEAIAADLRGLNPSSTQ